MGAVQDPLVRRALKRHLPCGYDRARAIVIASVERVRTPLDDPRDFVGIGSVTFLPRVPEARIVAHPLVDFRGDLRAVDHDLVCRRRRV